MEKLLQIIQQNSKKTGNGSGISVHKAWADSGMKLSEFVESVDRLQEQKKIYIREGINHQLLFAY